jgi:K+-sensing histidine kinase KdpD
MAMKALRMADDLPSRPQELNAIRETLHRQMLSAVSHDLKTPLATIIGSLEIYTRMDAKLTEEKKRIRLNTALGEAYRLDNFITNILDMAKLEGGDVKAKSERCNLTYLINDCLTRMGPKRDSREIHLLPERDGLVVNTDPMLLSRVINLILENAVRHASKHPSIDIEYGANEQKGHISVRDRGPGIPSGKEQEIFSKYTRFANTDHQNAGTGLGLAICGQIMRLLSGTITVSNHSEGGAIFLITFPSA